MSSFKAIKVSEDNRKAIEASLNLEEDDVLDEAMGLWMVVKFGQNAFPEGFLTDENYEKFYWETGVTLENGYVHVTKRVAGPL